MTLYVNEEDVEQVLEPESVYRHVIDWLTCQSDSSSVTLHATRHKTPWQPTAKAGRLDDGTVGFRLRPASRGAYWTCVWNSLGEFAGVVESAYLSYYRAASTLLSPLDAWKHDNLLVCGTGRLAAACVSLFFRLHPDRTCWAWSGNGHRSIARLAAAAGHDVLQFHGTVVPEQWAVLTVHSPRRVPLDLSRAVYLGLGGHVNGVTDEVDSAVLRDHEIAAVDPHSTKPWALRNRQWQPLTYVLRNPNPLPRLVCFANGGGAIDVYLAKQILRQREKGST